MYYLLYRKQLHVSALFMAIFSLIMKNVISSYTLFACVIYSGEVKGEVGTRSGMRCVGWVVWVLVLSVVGYSMAISYDYVYIYTF
jgi:hypothetical protein